MILISRPGAADLSLEHLLLDFNGTIACDGELIEGVGSRLDALSSLISLTVVTADTFGTVSRQLETFPIYIRLIGPNRQDEEKLSVLKELGTDRSACIGNGRNDRLILRESALGIAVIQEEGTALDALSAADVVCPSILLALDLLLNPKRLTATLRL
jgi:soluble P-type ATPase